RRRKWLCFLPLPPVLFARTDRATQTTALPEQCSRRVRSQTEPSSPGATAPFHVLPMLGRIVDVGALEQIIEAADPVPAIAVRLEQDMVLSVLAGGAVVLGEQVDQPIVGPLAQADGKTGLTRPVREIVNEDHGIVAPVVAHGEHAGIAGRQDGKV